MSRPLTVMQWLPALESGGVERGTLEIARALVAAGHRSLVVSAGGRLVDRLEREGSHHLCIDIKSKSLWRWQRIIALRQAIRHWQPDILHARSRLPAWLARLVLATLPAAERPRFVTTMHGLHSVNAYSAVMTSGEKVIAVSETVREHILAHYPRCPADRIVVIPRGVDPAEFPRHYRPDETWLQRWHREFPQFKEKRLIVLPGRISRIKGHDVFVRLLTSLLREQPDLHGVIVGEAEPGREWLAEQLREQVRSAGMSSHITFTGHRQDMREIYACASLVLSLTTKPESFGRTVLEALALGTPVVGWDQGGVGDILQSLFPAGRIIPGDEVALYERVRECLAHPAEPLPNERFLLEHMTAATLSLYGSLMAGNPVRQQTPA
jgi:glycosyltransferase involved in cell wall biosynthesis